MTHALISLYYIVKIVMYAYLNSTSTLLFEKYVFRLHVTVNDFVSVEQVQTLQEAVSKLSHQL